MKNLITYIIVFFICYLFYIVFVLKRKNIFNKFMSGKEITYLKSVYKLKVTEKNSKKIANCVFLVNSFILSVTLYIISFFDSMLFKVIIGFVVLFILILSLYHIAGKYLKNKQGGKN